MSSGPRKHGVVAPEVVGAIEAFFALRDWSGLWLSGGTCLAEYYFGHRVSVDVDLFTSDEELFHTARDVLRRKDALRPIGELETVRTDLQLCQYSLRCSPRTVVKIDLVHDLPVCLEPKVGLGEVWLDSLTDLASNKMGCLIQREDVKDFVDVFFLLPRLGVDAAEALELGRKKEAGLDPVILAEQMRWFLAQEPPGFLTTDVPWENIRRFFEHLRADVLRLVEPGGAGPHFPLSNAV